MEGASLAIDQCPEESATTEQPGKYGEKETDAGLTERWPPPGGVDQTELPGPHAESSATVDPKAGKEDIEKGEQIGAQEGIPVTDLGATGHQLIDHEI